MIEKLNKVFRNGQKLSETDLNPMSAKVDEIIEVVNKGSDFSNANDINVASTHPEDISPDGASLVLREANRMGSGSGTVYNSQAPRIGFNWKGRWWAQILMTSNVFKFVRGKDDTQWAGIQAGVIQGSSIKTHAGADLDNVKEKVDGMREVVVPDYYIDNDGRLYVKNYTPQTGDVIYMVRHIKSKFGSYQTQELTGVQHPRYKVRGPIRSKLALIYGRSGSSAFHAGTEIAPEEYGTFIGYMESSAVDKINLDRKCEIIIKRADRIYMSGIRFRVKTRFKYDDDHKKVIIGYAMSLW